MSHSTKLNLNHLRLARPLLKWKILDLQGLKEEANFDMSFSMLAMIVRGLERKKILKTYRHYLYNKKFLYLSEQGCRLLWAAGRAISTNEINLLHAMKLSEIIRIFKKKSCVEDVSIGHQVLRSKESLVQESFSSDAVIKGTSREKKITVAFDLELILKTKEQIKSKVDGFLSDGKYDYLAFFFATQSEFKSCKRYIKSLYGRQLEKRIMLFFNEEFSRSTYDLDKSEGFFCGKKVVLGEVFK